MTAEFVAPTTLGPAIGQPPPVKAAHWWPNNGYLIADVAKLYLRDDDCIFDATYGRGIWWSCWRPAGLVTNDLDLRTDADMHLDVRDLSVIPAQRFDVATLDLPYVAKGGRDTSGIKEMDARYGQIDCPATPQLLQDLINAGMEECARISRRLVLVKAMDYISSGKLWEGTFFTQHHAKKLGLRTLDRFEHIGQPGPQPGGRRQVHARRNLSTLFVFEVRP